MKKNTTNLVWLTLILSQTACAQKENTPPLKTPDSVSYITELIVPDVEVPWGMVFLPNGSLLYTEKEGKLIRFQHGKKNEISGVPTTYVRGQGGLMGIALHPDFKQNNRIYFTMATANEDASGGNTGLYTALLIGNTLSDVKLCAHRRVWVSLSWGEPGPVHGSPWIVIASWAWLRGRCPIRSSEKRKRRWK
jgi:glucose/arabinose dehydrogenase